MEYTEGQRDVQRHVCAFVWCTKYCTNVRAPRGMLTRASKYARHRTVHPSGLALAWTVLQQGGSRELWGGIDLATATSVGAYFCTWDQNPCTFEGTRWRTWLRHCTTSRKVAGSIPDHVIGIFHWHNPSGRTMALGSSQPLTEMSTRNISWG